MKNKNKFICDKSCQKCKENKICWVAMMEEEDNENNKAYPIWCAGEIRLDSSSNSSDPSPSSHQKGRKPESFYS